MLFGDGNDHFTNGKSYSIAINTVPNDIVIGDVDSGRQDEMKLPVSLAMETELMQLVIVPHHLLSN